MGYVRSSLQAFSASLLPENAALSRVLPAQTLNSFPGPYGTISSLSSPVVHQHLPYTASLLSCTLLGHTFCFPTSTSQIFGTFPWAVSSAQQILLILEILPHMSVPSNAFSHQLSFLLPSASISLWEDPQELGPSLFLLLVPGPFKSLKLLKSHWPTAPAALGPMPCVLEFSVEFN